MQEAKARATLVRTSAQNLSSTTAAAAIALDGVCVYVCLRSTTLLHFFAFAFAASLVTLMVN